MDFHGQVLLRACARLVEHLHVWFSVLWGNSGIACVGCFIRFVLGTTLSEMEAW